jgi:hypothetical protein
VCDGESGREVVGLICTRRTVAVISRAGPRWWMVDGGWWMEERKSKGQEDGVALV